MFDHTMSQALGEVSAVVCKDGRATQRVLQNSDWALEQVFEVQESRCQVRVPFHARVISAGVEGTLMSQPTLVEFHIFNSGTNPPRQLKTYEYCEDAAALPWKDTHRPGAEGISSILLGETIYRAMCPR